MSALRTVFGLLLLTPLACSSVSPDPVTIDPGGADAGPVVNGQSCGQAGNDLVYVVDSDYRLLSFDPQKIGSGDPFTLVGNLSCPAAAPWPDFPAESASATPFSMSVDRNGMAWVLYTSGEVFNVSIADARCTSTGFQKGQAGFQLFGMGFVSDSAGSDAETLFLAGGTTSEILGDSHLGSMSGALSVAALGDLPSGENNPELTGTADGELYAYYPGFFDSSIKRINKATAGVEQEWFLDPLGGVVSAWAFAHWGGKFYSFVTTEGLGTVSQVLVFDPATGQQSVAVQNSPYTVVGAGVSTCAPVVVE